jgi:hypothetical protein
MTPTASTTRVERAGARGTTRQILLVSAGSTIDSRPTL